MRTSVLTLIFFALIFLTHSKTPNRVYDNDGRSPQWRSPNLGNFDFDYETKIGPGYLEEEEKSDSYIPKLRRTTRQSEIPTIDVLDELLKSLDLPKESVNPVTRWKGIKSKITPQNVRVYEGIAGTHGFVSSIATKNQLISSDHGPPESVYPSAKHSHIAKLASRDRASVSMLHELHTRFITTGGGPTPEVEKGTMNEKELKNLEKTYKNPLYSQKTRSNAFTSELAALFKKGDYEAALKKQADAWIWNAKEGRVNRIKQGSDVRSVEMTLEDIVSPEKLKLLEELGGFKKSSTAKQILSDSNLIEVDGKYVNSQLTLQDVLKTGYVLIDSADNPSFSEFVKAQGQSYLTSDELKVKLVEFVESNKASIQQKKYNQLQDLGPEVKTTSILDASKKGTDHPFEALDRQMALRLGKGFAEDGKFHIFNPESTLGDFVPEEMKEKKLSNKLLVKDVFVGEEALGALKGTGISGDMPLADIFIKSQIPSLETKIQTKLLPQLRVGSDQFSSDLLDFHKVIDPDIDNTKQGIRVAVITSLKKFHNDEFLKAEYPDVWATGEDNKRNELREMTAQKDKKFVDEIVEEFGLNVVKKGGPEDDAKKVVTDEHKVYEKIFYACENQQRRKRRKRAKGGGGVGGACIAALSSGREECNCVPSGDNDNDDNDNGIGVKRKQMTENELLEVTVALKHSLESGDIVNKLAGIDNIEGGGFNDLVGSKVDDLSGDGFTNNALEAIPMDKIQIGKGSLKSAIVGKFKDLKQDIQDAHVTSTQLKRFGADVLQGFENIGKVTGVINKAFMVRNLASGVLRGDVKAVGQTLGMLGVAKLGNYLKKAGDQGKSIAGMSSKFVKNAGNAIGTGLDLVGIGFDLYSISQSVDCLHKSAENKKSCTERDRIFNSPNKTAILIILEMPNACASSFDICAGKEATVDIIANGISIGMNVIGMAYWLVLRVNQSQMSLTLPSRS